MNIWQIKCIKKSVLYEHWPRKRKLILGKFVERPLKTVIEDMSNADLVKLDRWTIETVLHEDVGSGGWNPDLVSGEKFECANASSKLPMSVLNNYYSIGIDAYIAYKFHEARDK